MHLTFHCPCCDHWQRSADLMPGAELKCSRCDWIKTLDESQVTPGSPPKECLRCGNTDLWRQKNFPQWLGLTCVAIGAVASSIAWGYHRPILALSILLFLALVDMVLYLVMPDILVCYRCQAQHLQADVSGCDPFNHELAERYRQERIRLERAEGAQSGSQLTEYTSPLPQG